MKSKNFKVSVCVTILNESTENISKLLDALNNQTLKPNEIIIIDAKDYGNCSRSEGRNIAIKKAKNEIIAITDCGCIPHKDWLQRITNPFKNNDADVVAGGYKMIAKNDFQKAESFFLGVNQNDMKEDFLPSARSMAFTKNIWKKAGGFPEELNDTAEDTVFNLKLIEIGAKFAVSKNAVVDWEMPNSIFEFFLKIYKYAKGDAKSGIWWHPVKKWQTHNIKILTIFLRYLLAFVLLGIGYWYLPQSVMFFLFILIAIYSIWAFKKARLWGIYLQFISDFSCIIGFSHGILSNCFKRN